MPAGAYIVKQVLLAAGPHSDVVVLVDRERRAAVAVAERSPHVQRVVPDRVGGELKAVSNRRDAVLPLDCGHDVAV